MSDQPKPTASAEWTPDMIAALVLGRDDSIWWRIIADAHNAALAAARKQFYHEEVGEWTDMIRDAVEDLPKGTSQQLRHQLAAETRKHSDITHKWEQSVIEIQELKAQLAAAEREKGK